MRKLGLVLLALLLWGCPRTIIDGGPPIRWDFPKLYVVNGLAETIGIWIPDSGGKYYDAVMTAGSVPNAFVEATGVFRLYLINSGFGGTPSVEVLDAQTDTVIAFFPLPEGSNPMQGVEVQDKLYLTSWTRGQVYRVDGLTGAVEDSLFVGPSLDGIEADSSSLYVVASFYDQTNFRPDTGKLYRVDLRSWRVTDSLTLGLNPTTVRWGPDGMLYVLHSDFGASALYRVNPQTFEVLDRITFEGQYLSGFFVRDTAALLTGWSAPLFYYNLARQSLIAEIPLPLPEGAGAMGAAFGSPDTAYVAVFNNQGPNYVFVVDLAQRAVVDSIPTGDGVGTQILKYLSL